MTDWNEEAKRLLPCAWENINDTMCDGPHKCGACQKRPAVAAALAAAVVQGLEMALKISGDFAGVYCGENTGGREQRVCETIRAAIQAEIDKRKGTHERQR